MEIELSPETLRLIEAKVASGDFANTGEVVEAAVKLLTAYDEAYWADVRAKVAEGLRQFEAGLGTPLDDDLIARVKANGRKRLAGGGAAAS
jgi:putative addiction module CopG family antidote